MNTKAMLLGGLILGGGYLLFKKFYGQGAVAGNVVTPYANSQLLAQPSLAYPFQAPQSARNDNQSEPWYGGSRAFNTQTAVQSGIDPNFLANVQYVQGFASITDSLGSIWSDLGVASWFSDENPDSIDFGDWGSVEDSFGDNFNWDSLNMWA